MFLSSQVTLHKFHANLLVICQEHFCSLISCRVASTSLFFFYLTLYKRMEVAEVNNSQSNQYGEETLRNFLFAAFQKLCTNSYVAKHKIVKSAQR